MIQLYSRKNEDFTKNGDCALSPLTATISAKLNGAWTLSVEHPIDSDGKWKYIVEGAVIKVPSFYNEDNQLYRIKTISKSDVSVKATAEPIFMDCGSSMFIIDRRSVNKNGQQALDIILSDQGKFKGKSNISTIATAYHSITNPIEAIQSNNDNSFLNRWGGEIIYDNYTIIINERAGGDYGVRIAYGKNIQRDGIKETVDLSGVVTRIVPQGYNGKRLSGSSPWVNSPIINTYPVIYTKMIEYPYIRMINDVNESEDTSGYIICRTEAALEAALRKAADDEFKRGIDKPAVNIECNIVLLGNTEEYSDIAELERVSLGDTVHCRHSKLGIVTDARITALTYDCIRKQVSNVTIGKADKTFVSRVSNVVKSAEKAITANGDVNADKVKGLINGALAQLRIQNTVAERQDVRAILFEDLDPSSPYFGAMGMGTQGFQISRERTPDNRDWVWTTFGTAAGFNANYINAGEINAIDITSSSINNGAFTATKDGKVEASDINITGGGININNVFTVTSDGALTATDATITGNISGSKITGSEITSTGTYVEDGITKTDAASFKDGSERIVSDWVYRDPGASGPDQLRYTYTNKGGFLTATTKHIKDSESGAFALIDPGTATYAATRLFIKNDYGASLLYDTHYGQGITLTDSGQSLILNPMRISTPGEIYASEITDRYGNVEHFYAGQQEVITCICAGHVTNSTKAIDFFIPLPKRPTGSSVRVDFANVSVRGISGYVGGEQYLVLTGIASTYNIRRNGIQVRLGKSTAYTNVNNNTPVTVTGTFTITFQS